MSTPLPPQLQRKRRLQTLGIALSFFLIPLLFLILHALRSPFPTLSSGMHWVLGAQGEKLLLSRNTGTSKNQNHSHISSSSLPAPVIPPSKSPSDSSSIPSEASSPPSPADSQNSPTNRPNFQTTTPPSFNPSVSLQLNDAFSQRLAQVGAKSGELQFSLEWFNGNDLDLHCIDPNGEEIYFSNRQSRSGGELDVDMNAYPPYQSHPVENIYWPPKKALPGRYQIYVVHYRNHGFPDPTLYRVRLQIRGRTLDFSGSITPQKATHLIHQFYLPQIPQYP